MGMQLQIDDDLEERLVRRAERKSFDSPEEYATTVLETVLDELEGTDSSDDVQSRLEDLGYLE